MGLALALHRGPGPGGPGGPATGTTGGAGWAGCRLSPLLGSLSVEESQPDQRSLDQTGSSGVNLASLFRAVRQGFDRETKTMRSGKPKKSMENLGGTRTRTWAWAWGPWLPRALGESEAREAPALFTACGGPPASWQSREPKERRDA